ncbi:unnamed protein product [Schistosoma margrebowiei]|uniref:Uncharacterized protein n=1 Tax=Schistosoma margrebowiei TaxID=48269 RepID=A0A183LG21_9TREM|nr:unnamed protein product [Schistosoma margrebowiei]
MSSVKSRVATLLSDSVKSRKTDLTSAESNCEMLLQELESREAYLQDLKNSLFKRVEVAEYQMNKLISLRNEETEEAQKASKILRSSIAKLRERFIIDKKELENKICSIQDTYEGRITELNNILRQSEKNRENLFAKFKTSEFTIQVGLDLDILSFKIHPCIKFLDVLVKTRSWLMIV